MLYILILLLHPRLCPVTKGGLGKPSEDIYTALFGAPCDCKGGTQTNNYATPTYTQVTDCGDKNAYLTYDTNWNGVSSPKWLCVRKPPSIPVINGRPGPCPSECRGNIEPQMHSSCYSSFSQCTLDNNTYFTAILQRTKSTSETNPVTSGLQPHGVLQAGCDGTVGKSVCWNQQAPIHVSDGGGPQDAVRELYVQKQIELIIQSQFPKLSYHPLARSKPRGPDIDAQMLDILSATHQALNISNPSLAQNCWLCLNQGTSMPLAFPVNISSFNASQNNCTPSLPFRVQPMPSQVYPCFFKGAQNNSFDIPVGVANFVNCSSSSNHSEALCPGPGQAFVCGNNLAFTALPANWTGSCVLAALLPDIDIISGDDPVPIPTFDYIAGRQKRAVTLIPLLVGLGVSTAVATGTAGLGVAVQSYTKLSHQLINDVQALSSTINDLQDQLDSLAEVVLQNRRGLDLLTAEQGGICLALQERCCFYANKSGIVRDKIKNLQEDLEQRRKALADNPFLTGLNGLLPYLLPFLGPLFAIILFFSFAPWILRRVTALIKDQLNSILGKPIQIHYHQLATRDLEYGRL